MALLILSCCLGCRLLFGNLLELLCELGGHEINGREVIQDGLENSKSVSDVHPLCPGQTTFERCIQVLMPTEQEIFELSMLHQSVRFPVLLETDSESKIWPVTRPFGLFIKCTQARLIFAWPTLLGRLILMPPGEISKYQSNESPEVLSLPDGAGEDQRSQPVCVKESVVERHELEVGRPQFVQRNDELVGVLCIRRREQGPRKEALLQKNIRETIGLDLGVRGYRLELLGQAFHPLGFPLAVFLELHRKAELLFQEFLSLFILSLLASTRHV